MRVRAFPRTGHVPCPPCAAEDDPRVVNGAADLVLPDGKIITVDPADSIA